MIPVKNSPNCRPWFIFLTFFSLILVNCSQSTEESSKALLPTAVPPPSAANSAPPARVYHMMVYDSTRQVTILFGGSPVVDGAEDSGEDEGVSHYFSDTWEYNGETWRQIDVASSPPGRYGHGLAYDDSRGVAVLYGGIASPTRRYADTWEYNGTTWLLKDNFAQTPGGREFPIMIFDPLQQVTFLLVGGMVDDMWAYDGESWQKTSTHVPPPIRYAITARAIFDSKRQVILLHEGNDSGWGDTLELIGNQLEYVATRGDEDARGLFDLAYDKRRGVSVLFGGSVCEWQEAESNFHCDPLNDTWEYDGNVWRLVEVRGSPPARYGHSMVYDTARGVVVLFGGVGSDGHTLNDTWEYNGATWVER